jgi:hypothetical protein
MVERTRALALSVRQPWAWTIVNGYKDVENRSWHTLRRGRLLIHAGQQFDQSGFRFLTSLGIEYPEEVIVGALVGSVELMDCVRDHPSPWARKGAWHWLLKRPVEFRTPICCVGSLGLFSPDVSPQQLSAAARYANRPRRKAKY